MTKTSILGAIMIALSLSGAAKAETLSHAGALEADSAMHAYLFSQDAHRQMYNLAVAFDRAFQIECDSEYRIKAANLVVLSQIELPSGADHPVAGVWTHRFVASRCGKDKTYNILAIAKPAGAPDYRPLFPGTSQSSVVLQRDAVTSALMGAIAQNKPACTENVRVFDIEMVAEPYELTEGSEKIQGVWEERWTFRACGKDFSTTLQYIPDGQGGTYFRTK